MPVQKEKKYEITIKSLRRREIPCLVIAVPQKSRASSQSEKQSGSGTHNSQDKSRSKILKRLKQRLNRLSTTPNKKSKSLSCLDSKSEVISKVVKKRVYRKKSLQIESPPRMNITNDVSNSTSDVSKDKPVASAETLKKRTYRKKIQIGATITPITGSPVSTSKVKSPFGTPVIRPVTPKRGYRKKLKIPAVPHNTPVMRSTSITSSSFFSHSKVITVGKRKRGRPRLSMPVEGLGSDNGEESRTSQGSDKGSTTRRFRRSLWADSDGEDEAENQVSEYELLRQKNIEENLRKLREIFTQQGLQFEEKSSESETPKKRKSYSRLPLPPPRPRSQRIEIRRTYMPLDFSKLDEKLTMSEESLCSSLNV